MIHKSPLPDVEIPDIHLTPYVLERAGTLSDHPAVIDGPTGPLTRETAFDETINGGKAQGMVYDWIAREYARG